ncbi:MAG: radical SAM/SPASM domain-containing protein [Chromatiales bacterium]
MKLPVVSPYLHPIQVSLDDGRKEIRFDHLICGTQQRLNTDEERLISILWPKGPGESVSPNAFDSLNKLCREIGSIAVSNAFHRLFQIGYLFSDTTACESILLSTMESLLEPVPLVDQVELTNSCPMTCRFCPRGITGGIIRPSGRMDFRQYETLLEQLPERQKEYHPLELDLMGESLLHPQVHKFVEAATQRGIPTELSLNPSLLTPELSQRIITAGISRIVISLDAMDNEVLAEIRGKAANYDKAASHLQALFTIAENSSNPPQIVIQMIDLARNQDQQEAFMETWNNTGKPFVVAYIKPLDGIDPDTGKGNDFSPRFPCTYPFTSVTILWDGSVVPCCRDANGQYILGNLNVNSLQEIWNGPKADKLREAYRLDNFRTGHLCENCAWRRSHYAATLWERHPERARFEPMHW